MSIGGIIKCNSTSNAYACCCQFLSRIKPVIQNSQNCILNYTPDSVEFIHHASLIDIYYQIKAGSDDIDISPFIHICDCSNKTTIDLITLLTTVLLHFDPNFKSSDEYLKGIFYTSLLDRNSIKFHKSVIFDFEFTESDLKYLDLTKSIEKQYNYISTKSKILLFRPTNKGKFNLSFYLSIEAHQEICIYSLFSFVITKHDNESHYILYFAKSMNIQEDWLCIDENNISTISHESLIEISNCEENNFIMFAFTEDLEKNIEFLCPELTKIPVMELTSISETKDSPTSSSNQQIPVPSLPEQTNYQNDQISPSTDISTHSPSTDISTHSPSKSHTKTDKSPKDSSSFDDMKLSLFGNDKCKIVIKLFRAKKMRYKDCYTKETTFYDAQRIVNQFLQKCHISRAYYSLKSEGHHKLHKHLTYDTEIYIYVQKPDEPQMLKFFVNSEKIKIKFECKEIKIFNTTATFDKEQPLSDLYDFCNILLEKILGLQIEEIELTKDGKKIINSSRYNIEDCFLGISELTLLFSYIEKY